MKKIDLMCSPSNNVNWLSCLYEFYQRTDLVGFNNDYRIKLMSFEYKKDDEASLILAMKNALCETQRVMIPVFDKVQNLDDCIQFFDFFCPSNIGIRDYENDIRWFYEYDYDEWKLYFQTDSHNDLIDKFEKKYQEAVRRTEVGRVYGEWSSLQDVRYNLEEYRLELIQNRDYVYNHPEIYKDVMKELKQRKIRNTEVLKPYGLEV